MTSTLMDALYVLGAIASIVGALFAWRHAWNAGQSATAAEEAKGALIERQRSGEAFRLLSEVSRAIDVSRPIAIGANPNALRGGALEEIKEALQKLVDVFAENKHYLPDSRQTEVSALMSEVQDRIPKLQVDTSDSIKRHGSKIHEAIQSLSGIVKQACDIS